MTRRGWTLVESLVALVLLATLGTALTRLVLVQGRLAARFATRAMALESVTQANDWLAAELESGGSIGGSSDLLAVAGDSLVYRAWRGAGLACGVGPGEVRVLRERFTSWRAPQPGRDSLALLLPGDSAHPDTWLRLPVLGSSASNCGGRPAIAMAIGTMPAVTVTSLAPVRVYEVALVKLYRSLGEWWLGARSVSGGEGLQPVTGPYRAGGVHFSYRNRDGALTATGDSAATIDIQLLPIQGGAVRARILRRNVP